MKVMVLLSQAFSSPAASPGPPPLFIDKGACPFECCTYRQWTVKRDTLLYDAVNGTRIVGRAAKGAKVRGLTGEVHTIPLKAKTKAGREVYMLTYLGEGFWKIWDNGAVKQSGDDALNAHARPQSTWWVRIGLPNGTVGWTKQPENFGNIDACG